MKGDYEEFHALRQQKNKANSRPIKPDLIVLFNPKVVEKKRQAR
jgi:hypothetical protein